MLYNRWWRANCPVCGAWVDPLNVHACDPALAAAAQPWLLTTAGATICGIVSHSGAKGEPLACGFPAGHSGAHAWATLPTFTTRAEVTSRAVGAE